MLLRRLESTERSSSSEELSSDQVCSGSSSLSDGDGRAGRRKELNADRKEDLLNLLSRFELTCTG